MQGQLIFVVHGILVSQSYCSDGSPVAATVPPESAAVDPATVISPPPPKTRRTATKDRDIRTLELRSRSQIQIWNPPPQQPLTTIDVAIRTKPPLSSSSVAVTPLLHPNSSSSKRRQSPRLPPDNAKVQGLQIGGRVADSFGFKGAGQDGISSSGLASLEIGMDPAAFLEDHSAWDFCIPLIISQADVLCVFKLILQIAMSMSGHEHVQVEAVAIMITIVVRTDAYREREKWVYDVMGKGNVFHDS
ncbi:hypothetical protein AKJ16_DCAP09052 [Drosera capensis]